MKQVKDLLVIADATYSLFTGNPIPLIIHGIGFLEQSPDAKELYASALFEVWKQGNYHDLNKQHFRTLIDKQHLAILSIDQLNKNLAKELKDDLGHMVDVDLSTRQKLDTRKQVSKLG